MQYILFKGVESQVFSLMILTYLGSFIKALSIFEYSFVLRLHPALSSESWITTVVSLKLLS